MYLEIVIVIESPNCHSKALTGTQTFIYSLLYIFVYLSAYYVPNTMFGSRVSLLKCMQKQHLSTRLLLYSEELDK